MTYFELITKIKEDKIEYLPLEIRYHGVNYTREDAGYTYYIKGKDPTDTLYIDTMDLDNIVEVVCDKREHDELSDLCDKLRDLLESIEDKLDD